MSSIDGYLDRVSRGLAGMDATVRRDILRELRSHLADAAAETDESRAVSAAEPPEQVATRYKQLYGYGVAYRTLFVTIAAALAVPTLPLLLYTDELPRTASLVATGFLVALVAYLLAVAVKAGSRVGLVGGIAACAARFATLAALSAVAGAVVPDVLGWILFTASSVLLVVVGYVPGAAKEKWKPRDAGL